MTSIDQAAAQAAQEPTAVDLPFTDLQELETDARGFKIDLDFLWIETGEGSVDEYLEHPLNFKKSAGLAQVIRGISGVVGNAFNYWWVDVIMGGLKMGQEAKSVDKV